MNAKKKKLTFVAGAVSALLIGGAIAAKVMSGPPAPRYLTQPVKVGDVERTVLASGALQPLEIVDVGAQASGQIQSLNVRLGDKVTRGQLLAVIDPATQQNTLRTGEAQLAQQNAQRLVQIANLTRARQVLARQRALMDSGFGLQDSYDQAATSVTVGEANLTALDAQIRQAQISVDRAKVDLGRTNIVAPIDGVVSDIAVRQGQTVNAVQAAPTIVRIAKMEQMTVKAKVSEADVINIRPGMPVYFTILGDPDRRYQAVLRQIEPAPEGSASQQGGGGGSGASSAAVYYNALFDVPNADGRLRPSMTAQVNVVLAQAKGVLTVPSSALGPASGGKRTVKVMGADNKVAERQVTVGLNDNVSAEVKSGLKAGEKVVVGSLTPAQAAQQLRESRARM